MQKILSLKHHRIVLVTVVCVIGFGLLSLVIGHKNDTPETDAPIITFSTDTPDEQRPQDAGYKWQGRDNDPKRIIIEKLDVDELIQNVGIDQNSQIAVPNNIHIAGWFVDSVRPGEQGLSIIDGHVNGPHSDAGVFKRINELQKGDEVKIVFGDNSEKVFKVYDNQSVENNDAGSLLYSQIPTLKRQLNLITCTGSYDSAEHNYTQRQITILERI